MNYVRHVLQNGEEIRYDARLHWIIYAPGFIVLLAAVVVFVVAESAENGKTFWLVVAAALGLIAFVQLFRAWFLRWTTEIAVTNRRVIYKEGFIRRNTVEMHMDKVESVDVDQSILGRILNYGTVVVRGTGAGLEPIKNIAAPLEFRNHVTGI